MQSFVYGYSFIVHVKTEDIYKDIVEDVVTKFKISNFELHWPLPKGKNRKVTGLMKDELGGKNLERICWIKTKNM